MWQVRKAKHHELTRNTKYPVQPCSAMQHMRQHHSLDTALVYCWSMLLPRSSSPPSPGRMGQLMPMERQSLTNWVKRSTR